MEHQLKFRRQRYSDARMLLSSVNRIKRTAGIPDTRSFAMSNLNLTRAALLKEMKRVAWHLWPTNRGRPYIGDWVVCVKPAFTGRLEILQARGSKWLSHVYIGSLLKCIAFVNRSKYGDSYYITKQRD